jgi:hypothetical protein
MEITGILREFMETGADWERKRSSVNGISLLRLPATKTRPASLAIEVNPIGENGRPMKRKGLILMSSREFSAFRALFDDPKVEALMGSVDEVVPAQKSAMKESEGDILEI